MVDFIGKHSGLVIPLDKLVGIVNLFMIISHLDFLSEDDAGIPACRK